MLFSLKWFNSPEHWGICKHDGQHSDPQEVRLTEEAAIEDSEAGLF